MSGPSVRVVVVVGTLAALASCGDDGVARKGTSCGATTCAVGQVCCLDCDGQGTCGAPGSVCPGTACQPPGADAGPGLSCGSSTCEPGQVCCVDCNGQGSCGAPGSVCTGAACVPDAGAVTEFQCGNIFCEQGQTCCGTCTSPFCGPPGSDCASPADCPPCGDLDQTCCMGGCLDPLECCAGVPYPEGGVCKRACEAVSDRALKEDVVPVDPHQVLERLGAIPITAWSYRADRPGVRHLGPMAQDFHAAFGLGRSDRRIDLLDEGGVALAAIQALRENVDSLRHDNETLRHELADLRARLEACAPPSP